MPTLDARASEALQRASRMSGIDVDTQDPAAQSASAGEAASVRAESAPEARPRAQTVSIASPPSAASPSTVGEPAAPGETAEQRSLRVPAQPRSLSSNGRAVPERGPRTRLGTRRGEGKELLLPMSLADEPWEDISEAEAERLHRLTVYLPTSLKLKLEWLTHHRPRTSMNSFVVESAEKAADLEIARLKRRG